MTNPTLADVVVSRDGARIGTIEELILDVRGGAVAYAVVSRWGKAGETFTVPWSALKLDTARDCFVLEEAAAIP